jgi:hypothetical protein
VLVLGGAIGLARCADRIPVISPIIKPDTAETLVQGVQRLDELATAKIAAQVIIPWEENVRIVTQPLSGFLTGEKVHLVVTGEVEVGIDLAELGKLRWPRLAQATGKPEAISNQYRGYLSSATTCSVDF